MLTSFSVNFSRDSITLILHTQKIEPQLPISQSQIWIEKNQIFCRLFFLEIDLSVIGMVIRIVLSNLHIVMRCNYAIDHRCGISLESLEFFPHLMWKNPNNVWKIANIGQQGKRNHMNLTICTKQNETGVLDDQTVCRNLYVSLDLIL